MDYHVPPGNEIALHNRGDCCPDRLSNFRVSIYNGATGTDVLSLREVEIFGTAVPEPSVGLLAGLAGLVLLRRRRS
jgi:MYXO-CTERM domain-containing protein